jgi:hypothetical protein
LQNLGSRRSKTPQFVPEVLAASSLGTPAAPLDGSGVRTTQTITLRGFLRVSEPSGTPEIGPLVIRQTDCSKSRTCDTSD